MKARMDEEGRKMNSHDWHDFWVMKIEPITCHMNFYIQPCSINFLNRYPSYPLTVQLKISKGSQDGSEDDT